MNKLLIDEIDFKKMYKKLLYLYNVGYLTSVEISEFALIANKNGYNTNFNFELEKTNICECKSSNKILTKNGFVCMNCNRFIR